MNILCKLIAQVALTIWFPDLPAAPMNLTALWYRDRKVNLTWSWPKVTMNKKTVQNYEFNVSYGESMRDKDRIQWTSVSVVGERDGRV